MLDLVAQEEFRESQHFLYFASALAEPCFRVGGKDKREEVKDPFVDLYRPAMIGSRDDADDPDPVGLIFQAGNGGMIGDMTEPQRVRPPFTPEIGEHTSDHDRTEQSDNRLDPLVVGKW